MNKISKQQAAKLKKAVTTDNGPDEDELIEFFMEYWMDNGEMPYGTQKARDGDPYNWTADQMEKVGKSELIDIIDELTEGVKLKDLVNERLMQEAVSYRHGQLIKNVEKMIDDAERLEKITKTDSVTAKMVKEFGGDDKLLVSINKKLGELTSDLEDLLRSCYSIDQE